MDVHAHTDLAGIEIALTGPLASMDREEARRRIAAAGATLVAAPGERTGLLVVGQGGALLGDDGKLTASLRTARELRARGLAIRIVDEDELLARLGLDERRDDLRRLYTLTQLARILDVPVSRVRVWMRNELIRPVRVVRRLCFFDFAQVATAKALAALTREGVTPARIRRSLEQLREWLPDAERALAQLETLERDGPLLIRTADGALAETSGQLRLDFAAPATPAPAVPDAPPTRLAAAGKNADAWFDLGLAAEEEGLLDEAVDAYERALAAGGPQPEVCFNLGNVLYSLERGAEAARSLRRAVELDAEYVEAWNNLGVVLGELDRVPEAIRALRHALALEPAYADAHYNLAETLAAAGDPAGAERHWRAYLEHDPHSSWAAHVRTRLAGLEAAPPGPDAS